MMTTDGSTMRRAAAGVLVAIGCTALIVGCATLPAADEVGMPSASTSTPHAPENATSAPDIGFDTSGLIPGEELECGGAVVPADALLDPVTLAMADEETTDAIASAVDDLGDPASGYLPGDPGSWIVVSSDDGRIGLLRRTDTAAGYESVWIEPRPGPEPGEDILMVSSAGACSLRRATEGLTEAAVSLDPDRPPTPEATAIHLLVTELACHGGDDASGRVSLVSIEESDTAVEIVVGVRPDDSSDAWTCPSNPATPFAVELSEPLGDRDILDAARVPATAVTPLAVDAS